MKLEYKLEKGILISPKTYMLKGIDVKSEEYKYSWLSMRLPVAVRNINIPSANEKIKKLRY